MEKELIKALIDNKNICEDFTDVFHDNFYVEDYTENVTKQAFYICGQLFEVSYRWGDNVFRIRSLETPVNPCAIDRIREAVKSLNYENVCVLYSECGISGAYTSTGMFYFNED